MESNELDAYQRAYNRQFKFFYDDSVMLSWYANRLLERLKRLDITSLISLGIGHGTVAQHVLEWKSDTLDRYVILEGSSEILCQFETLNRSRENVEIVHTLFEQYQSNDQFDAVEMGFVLEHVDDPEFVVKHFKNLVQNF